MSTPIHLCSTCCSVAGYGHGPYGHIMFCGEFEPVCDDGYPDGEYPAVESLRNWQACAVKCERCLVAFDEWAATASPSDIDNC